MNMFFKAIERRAAGLLVAAAALLSLPLGAQPASDVDFTLTLNTGVDNGEEYTNAYAGDIGPENRFVIGFQIELTSVDGSPVTVDPVAAFCSEIAEPIGVGTHTFEAAPLRGLAAGTGGQAGTASSGIPTNGIGNARAAKVQYFFDQYYTSTDLTGWTQMDLHAFQLGLWEITHDTDLDLASTLGTHYYGAQSGDSQTFRNDALTQSQTWLDDVAANADPSYTSTMFDFWALTDDGAQDVVLALPKGTPDAEELSELIVVPEPAMVLWMLPALALALFLKRR